MVSTVIDTGDSVFHKPSGETWTVAYVQGNRLAWCGWPEGEARLEDCILTEKASPAYRLKLLKELANMNEEDARRRYARHILALAGDASAQTRESAKEE